jgi:hypothetical protein
MTLQAPRPTVRPPRPLLWVALAALATTSPTHAEDKPATPRLGDHPAVVVQRLQRAAGYDYASKFYPHPAQLHLLPASPDELERLHAAARAARIDTDPVPQDALPAALAQGRASAAVVRQGQRSHVGAAQRGTFPQ